MTPTEPTGDSFPRLPESDDLSALVNAPWTDADLELYGLRSALDGGMLFCGVTHQEFAIGGIRYQWPRNTGKLLWSLGFSRLGELSDLDCKGAMIEALGEISAVCNLDFEYTANDRVSHVHVIATRLDGPSGVLADMQIPVGNVSDTTQLRGRMDDGDAYGLYVNPPSGKIDFYRVILHEWLHACGLGHQPASDGRPALIAPMYSTRIRNLQAADVGELQLRYGKREVAPPPPPDVPTGAVPIEVRTVITQGAKKWVYQGEAKRIQ